MDTRTEPFAGGSRAIAEIAHELDIPIERVDRVFQREISRLLMRARVRQFIPILAMRDTRHLLREHPSGQTVRSTRSVPRGYQMSRGRQ